MKLIMENWKKFLNENPKTNAAEISDEQWVNIHKKSYYINLLRILTDWLMSKDIHEYDAHIWWQLSNFNTQCAASPKRKKCTKSFGGPEDERPALIRGRFGGTRLLSILKHKAKEENKDYLDLYNEYIENIDEAANAIWLKDYLLGSDKSKTKMFFDY